VGPSNAEASQNSRFSGGVGQGVLAGPVQEDGAFGSNLRQLSEVLADVAHSAPGSHEQHAGSAIPRGPPRKPKQSGHALWVGNLPPAASIVDLKDHFSRSATKDIESVFLISKSNCAFVNYRTEAACASAMQRFHDSRFQGVRLVCRPRRGSAPTAGSSAGPSTPSTRRPSQSPQPLPIADVDENPEDIDATEAVDGHPLDELNRVPERYFILKSRTLQDLEQSVRNGIWATQSHNEATLNNAYKVGLTFLLLFSLSGTLGHYADSI
jgi:RNA recognition motif-containing protein